jgi:hypothetical protein
MGIFCLLLFLNSSVVAFPPHSVTFIPMNRFTTPKENIEKVKMGLYYDSRGIGLGLKK